MSHVIFIATDHPLKKRIQRYDITIQTSLFNLMNFILNHAFCDWAFPEFRFIKDISVIVLGNDIKFTFLPFDGIIIIVCSDFQKFHPVILFDFHESDIVYIRF